MRASYLKIETREENAKSRLRGDRMKVLDDLIKKYEFDTKDRKMLEDLTEAAMTKSMDKRIEFFELLFLWERTSRFKENKQYKNATFEQYLWGRYMMRKVEYHRERIALLEFPEATEEFGVSTIVEVKNKCGVVTAPKVFIELQKEKAKQNVKHLEPQQMSEIIQKYERPRISVATNVATISGVEIQLKDEIRLLKKELAERDNQITKLKITIETLRSN